MQKTNTGTSARVQLSTVAYQPLQDRRLLLVVFRLVEILGTPVSPTVPHIPQWGASIRVVGVRIGAMFQESTHEAGFPAHDRPEQRRATVVIPRARVRPGSKKWSRQHLSVPRTIASPHQWSVCGYSPKIGSGTMPQQCRDHFGTPAFRGEPKGRSPVRAQQVRICAAIQKQIRQIGVALVGCHHEGCASLDHRVCTQPAP